jgi:antitoxin MazE
MTVHVHLTKVGNSRGIRIPRAILDQINLEGELDLIVQDGGLLIRPLAIPRRGWEETFSNGVEAFKEDGDLVEPLVQNQFDDEEWTW